MNKNSILSFLLIFIIFCCIFQSIYSLFYLKPFHNIENFDTINDTQESKIKSLGEYNTPIKYFLFDFSGNNIDTDISSLSVFTMINSNIEKLDLLNKSIASHKEYNNKVLFELNNNINIRLSELNKITIESKDYVMQDRILSCSFFDENKNLISKINLEVLHDESLTKDFRIFIYYNMSHYGDNSLPLDYNTNDISNIYFKTFFYENDNESKLENNCDFDLYNLNLFKDYNIIPSLNSNTIIDKPIYNSYSGMMVPYSEMYENDEDLDKMMYNLEQSSSSTNYKETFGGLQDNVMLNTSNNTNTSGSSYIQSYRGQVLSNPILTTGTAAAAARTATAATTGTAAAARTATAATTGTATAGGTAATGTTGTASGTTGTASGTTGTASATVTEGKTALEILKEQRAKENENAISKIKPTDDKWCLDLNDLNKECSLMSFDYCETLGYETYNDESNCESARLQAQQAPPPPPPTTPGCYVYTNDTCPKQSFNNKGKWFYDKWGANNKAADESDENCEIRKNDYNNWCGSTDFIYKFNPPSE